MDPQQRDATQHQSPKEHVRHHCGWCAVAGSAGQGVDWSAERERERGGEYKEQQCVLNRPDHLLEHPRQRQAGQNRQHHDQRFLPVEIERRCLVGDGRQRPRGVIFIRYVLPAQGVTHLVAKLDSTGYRLGFQTSRLRLPV